MSEIKKDGAVKETTKPVKKAQNKKLEAKPLVQNLDFSAWIKQNGRPKKQK